MKYCRNCGKQILDDASFCIHCMNELCTKKLICVPYSLPESKKRLCAIVIVGGLLVAGFAVWMLNQALISQANMIAKILPASQTTSQQPFIDSADESPQKTQTLDNLNQSSNVAGNDLIVKLQTMQAEKGIDSYINYGAWDFIGTYYPQYLAKLSWMNDAPMQILFSAYNSDFVVELQNVTDQEHQSAINDLNLVFCTFAKTQSDAALSFMQDNETFPLLDCDYEYADFINDMLYAPNSPYIENPVDAWLDEGTVVRSQYKEQLYQNSDLYFEIRTRTEPNGETHYDYTLAMITRT